MTLPELTRREAIRLLAGATAAPAIDRGGTNATSGVTPDGSTWPMPRGGSGFRNYNPTVTGIEDPDDPTWTTVVREGDVFEEHFGQTIHPEQPPIVGDGRVVIAPDGNDVYAFDATNGDRAWTFTAGGSRTTLPAFHDGAVMVGSGRTLHAIDATTGEERFAVDLGVDAVTDLGSGTPPLTVAGDRLYLYPPNQTLVAVDLSDRQVAWTRSMRHSLTYFGSRVFAAAVVDDRVVVVADDRDGNPAWHALSDEGDSSTVDWVADVTGEAIPRGPPVIHRGTVYWIHQFITAREPEYGITAHDLATGERLWRGGIGGDTYLAVGGSERSRVYTTQVALREGAFSPYFVGVLEWVDPATGERISGTPGGIPTPGQGPYPPVLVDGTVYTTVPNVLDEGDEETGTSKLVANHIDSDERWTHTFEFARLQQPAVTGDGLYLYGFAETDDGGHEMRVFGFEGASRGNGTPRTVEDVQQLGDSKLRLATDLNQFRDLPFSPLNFDDRATVEGPVTRIKQAATDGNAPPERAFETLERFVWAEDLTARALGNLGTAPRGYPERPPEFLDPLPTAESTPDLASATARAMFGLSARLSMGRQVMLDAAEGEAVAVDLAEGAAAELGGLSDTTIQMLTPGAPRARSFLKGESVAVASDFLDWFAEASPPVGTARETMDTALNRAAQPLVGIAVRAPPGAESVQSELQRVYALADEGSVADDLPGNRIGAGGGYTYNKRAIRRTAERGATATEVLSTAAAALDPVSTLENIATLEPKAYDIVTASLLLYNPAYARALENIATNLQRAAVVAGWLALADIGGYFHAGIDALVTGNAIPEGEG